MFRPGLDFQRSIYTLQAQLQMESQTRRGPGGKQPAAKPKVTEAGKKRQFAFHKTRSPPKDLELHLPDEVTVSGLAKLLEITTEEAEVTLQELGVTVGSDQELVSPSNAELVAMAHGRTVTFSKAVLVSFQPSSYASCVLREMVGPGIGVHQVQNI